MTRPTNWRTAGLLALSLALLHCSDDQTSDGTGTDSAPDTALSTATDTTAETSGTSVLPPADTTSQSTATSSAPPDDTHTSPGDTTPDTTPDTAPADTAATDSLVADTTTAASDSTPDSDIIPSDIALRAVPGKTTIGLEWDKAPVPTTYTLYWSTAPNTPLDQANVIHDVVPGFIHTGLTDGTTYYYRVTATTAAGESAPSPEISAVPGGDWVLVRLGTGDFDDIRTGAPVFVPVQDRVHILLFAEGYTAADQDAFVDDVAEWIDDVFAIEPYSLFPEAFVVWSLPAVSATTIRDSNPQTAFQVPVDASGSFAYMGNVSSTGETAQLAWERIHRHPYDPTDFSGPVYRRARNAIAAFLIFDPNYGRASVSGRATSLTDPDNTNHRIAAAFGVGHAHEFSHAFGNLRDEYLENDNQAPTNWSETSNVVGTNRCDELPWQHLLAGTEINPNVDELVGAFGTAAIGYHSELLCLMNGTHDNGEYYARNDSGRCQANRCTLRTEHRFCNFCREMVALRIFQRTGILDANDAGFDTWVQEYRLPFYRRFGFQTPAVIPQSNDVYNPEDGTPIFEACVP